MTLGPFVALLALFGRDPGILQRCLAVFGRVPLFYYLLHFPLIHLVALALSFAKYQRVSWLFGNPPWSPDLMAAFPKDYGYGLAVVYVVWIGTVVVLYPICSWFAGVKRRSTC